MRLIFYKTTIRYLLSDNKATDSVKIIVMNTIYLLTIFANNKS